MARSPRELVDPKCRSPETYMEWLSRTIGFDILSEDPEKLREFFRAQQWPFYQSLLSAYTDLHEHYPGGVSVPVSSGERLLCWNEMGTAGKAPMGGIQQDLPLNCPLAYDGIVFTDGLALPQYMLRTPDPRDLLIHETIAWGRVQEFFDVLIDFAPMIASGQVQIISESSAFKIAKPEDEYEGEWLDEELREAILEDYPTIDSYQLFQIQELIGYIELAAAVGAEVAHSDDFTPASEILHNYLASVAFAEAPARPFSRLPTLQFDYLFTPEAVGMTKREIARTIARMAQCSYWMDVRQVFRNAAEEARSRAEYNKMLEDGMEWANDPSRHSDLPPIVGKIRNGVAQRARYFGEGAASSYLARGVTFTLGCFIGPDDLGGMNNQAVIGGLAGLATGEITHQLVRRFAKKPKATAIVEIVTGAIQDPSAKPVRWGDRTFHPPRGERWP